MEKSSAFLLLMLCLVGKLSRTNGIIIGKEGYRTEIAKKKEWYVLFTTENNAFMGEVGRVHCGGALVAQDMVLTAAHCFDKFIAGKESLSRYTAWVGRQAMCRDNGDIGRAFALEEVYWDRERYNISDERNLHDYALVKIVEFGESICDRGSLIDNTVLATYAETEAPIPATLGYDSFGAPTGYYVVHDQLDLYGFGRIYSIGVIGPTSPILLKANGTKWSDIVCDIQYTGDDFASRIPYQFCVFPSLSCFGDSGGALVKGDDVVGITSLIINSGLPPDIGFCNSEFDFYTKIESYKDDIFNRICDVSEYRPKSCPEARIREGADLPKPKPSTMETRAKTVLTTLTRAGRFFWGDWFN